MDLENRIRDCIKYQLDELTNDGKLAGRKSMQLVPFVGNGLSRIALARYQNQGDESFYKIVADLGNQLELPPIDHLIAKGYTLDEVFRIVIEKGGTESRKNTMYEIWKLYRDIVPDVENGIPSPLHIVLAKMAKAFITTNYDLLIERALQAEGVSRFKQDFCITAPMHKWNSEPFIKWDPESSLPWIYKIHGSFLSLPDSYPAS